MMKKAGINVPNEDVSRGKTADIEKMVTQLWDKDQFPIEHQRIALTLLTQLCDSLVWWTQRYKKPSNQGNPILAIQPLGNVPMSPQKPWRVQRNPNLSHRQPPFPPQFRTLVSVCKRGIILFPGA
ncbi:hypothetical protein [Coleofasciculus chthonoplastes]|jgi:hypothetical protein|uniref:hypothetical protein n=1 Tax=Coleofasciculus chthonoplastes TaxID=64178 RepID=UPI0033031E0C